MIWNIYAAPNVAKYTCTFFIRRMLYYGSRILYDNVSATQCMWRYMCMHISMQYHAQKAFTLFSICVPRNMEELTV